MKKILIPLVFVAAQAAMAIDAYYAPASTFDTAASDTQVDLTQPADLTELIKVGDAWTLQFTVSPFSAGGAYPTLVSIAAEHNNNYAMVYTPGDNTTDWFLQGGGYFASAQANNANYHGTYSSFDTSVAHTYTLVSTGVTESASSTTLTLYIDGSEVVSGAFNFGGQLKNRELMFVLGDKANGTNQSMDATYSNVALYKGAYTPAELSAAPEPATATLSLLALAGLAARRRRK